MNTIIKKKMFNCKRLKYSFGYKNSFKRRTVPNALPTNI